MFENFDNQIERYFIDPHGVVYTQIDSRTLKVPENKMFKEYPAVPYEEPSTVKFQYPHNNDRTNWGKDTFMPDEFWSYENCGMCTGAYLNALCAAMRNPATDTPQIRQRAKRTFDAQQYIFKIGSELEFGFFPKIWGGKFSHQTSTDQMLYTMHSLHNYYPFASEEDKINIKKYIIAMADFWWKRNYTMTWYNLLDMKWPRLRFPSFLMMAYKYSGDEKYRAEALRILDEDPDNIVEHAVKAPYLCFVADTLSMDTMNIEMMTQFSPLPENYCRIMLDGLKKQWFHKIKTITPDGYFYNRMDYDLQTGIATPQINGCTRSAWSTMIVRSGLLLSRFIPELQQQAVELAEHVLSQLKFENMYYCHPDDVENLEPAAQFKTRFLSGDAITNRQWAYYLLAEYKSQTH